MRSIKGGYWVIATLIAASFISFGKAIFIAHVFELNDLGIITAAILMMDIMSTFTQTGFEIALIQKKEEITDYLDTAWTASVIKGIILFIILYFSSPLLASFKISEDKLPLAISVFRVMGLCFILQGFRNIGAVYFNKNLDFHKTFILSVISTLADFILSIGLVILFRSIWGIVTGRLVSVAVNSAGSYVLSDFRPRFHFVISRARELWIFGRWILGQNIIGYFLNMGENFFVWFYLGAEKSLPLYQYACQFSNMPATHITQVISQVSFPAYSKIQNDLPRLRDAYLKVMRVTSFLSFPAAALIFIMGPDFVKLFLPERMHSMVLIVQILALKGLLNSIGSTRGPLFYAMNKVRENWIFQGLRLIVLMITIYPLTKYWGIAGTAVSSVIVALAIRPYIFFYICRLLNCSAWTLLQPSVIPLTASVLMVLFIELVKMALKQNTFILFFVLVILGILFYLGVLSLLDRLFKGGFLHIIGEQIRLIKGKWFPNG